MQFFLYIFLAIITCSLFAESSNYLPDENSWELSTPEMEKANPSAVKKIMELSFDDDATQAVVIVKNGKIISEKYADGFDKTSHGTSWSMAKSYYAALIGISLDKGEINSLDDRVGEYLDYYNDERYEITIRDLLNMSSGLDFPRHEHEKMFFQENHLRYAAGVGLEKKPGEKFEYNNVNSMIIGEILFKVTNKKADTLFIERILDKIGVNNYKLWKDEAGNVMTYCCVDMSARDYTKIGLLFARNGQWKKNQIIPKSYVDETFQIVWDTPSRFSDYKRYYSLHWWVSKYEAESKIFNTSGKFGQYTFVDRENDVVVTRITKYKQNSDESVQKLGPLKSLQWLGIANAIRAGRLLLEMQIIEEGTDIVTPYTDEKGESNEFYSSYEEIVNAISDISS